MKFSVALHAGGVTEQSCCDVFAGESPSTSMSMLTREAFTLASEKKTVLYVLLALLYFDSIGDTSFLFCFALALSRKLQS